MRFTVIFFGINVKMIEFFAISMLANLLFLISITFLYIKYRKVSMARQPSMDLTEFLRDQATYGYSICRIDPQNVMLRSPRTYD